VVTEEEVAKYPIIDVEIEPGSVLFFDQGLIHSSGTNSSAEVRYSLVGVYHDTFHESFEPHSRQMLWKTLTPDAYFDRLYGDPST